MSLSETSLTNEQLVFRFTDGDDTVFGVLVDRLMPMLRQEISRIRCNRADGDDLAQEALLALLAAAEKYRADGGASFSTFARVCVRNRLMTVARTMSFPETPHDEEQLFDEIDREGGFADPNDWLLDREKDTVLIERLKSTLSDLEYRVLMFHLAAYSYEEMAAAMDISVKAVDNALQRIRKKLAKVL